MLENLEFFLGRLRGLPHCRSMDLAAEAGGGFCLSTGSDAASENWAFFPASISDEGPVRSALRFFETCGLPFVWPLLGDGEERLIRLGLREAGRLLAMSRGCDGLGERDGLRVAFEPVGDDAGAGRWADAVWFGFGAEAGAPNSFSALAAEMRRDGALRLVTARVGDRDAGAFLVALDPSRVGVYYFAVLPFFRRMGVATAMMREIVRIARVEGRDRIVLQATPSGVPFYQSVGFESLSEIPLFSTSDDVF